MPSEITRTGFQWEQVTVTRKCEHKGHLFLSVKTDKEVLNIRITPKGRIRLDEQGLEKV